MITKFTASSAKNPCPVCGRTKDGDCRLTGDGRVFCHSYQNYKPGETLRGVDGQEWACIGRTTDGAGWGIFKVHQPLEQSPRWQKPPRPKSETFYYYPDRNGNPLVRVKRIDRGDGTKTFSQERWDGSQWKPKLGDLDRSLIPVYRYKDVKAAIARGEPILWVEGEKVADLLWEIGLPATTSLGGSGGFTKYGDYSQDVAGASLVICPDRDPKGIAYAEQVARYFGATQWIYAGDAAQWDNPGDGYDLADWINDLRSQGLDDAAIKARILGAIGDRRKSPKPTDDGATSDKPERKPVANLLIEIARTEAQVWQSDSGDTWADITVNGVFQWHPVRSKAFKNWLSRRLFELHAKPANNEAMQACLNLLEAYAYGTPKRPVFLRTAQHDGHIYIDLSDDRWRVVQVSPDGWRVIDSRDCPVRFARHDGQQPLPVPVPGGDINKLWELIPVIRESDRCLLLAWLTFALVPWGAKPILTLHGAKGAGKSWTAQTISYLVDPVKAPLLKAVGDSRQMAVAASKRWILAFDNLTSLTTDEQDCLCCAATGAGFSHRKLHTDLDEVFYEYTRPQILTAVDCVPTRSDLLDRCLLIAVDRIPEDQRVPLKILESLREQYRPALLGALLDRVVLGLKYQDTIKAPLPRMADFARFAMEVEYGQGKNGLQSGSFASAYQENIAGAVEKAIESDPVAAAILELMSTCTRWEGSAGALVEKLQDLSDDPRIKKLTARGLGRWLSSKANQTDLQAVGVVVDSYRKAGGNRERGWLLTWADKPPKITSQTSLTSQTPINTDSQGGTLFGTFSDNVPKTSLLCPADNVQNVPPPEVPNGAASGKANPHEGDIRDIRDVFPDGLSGGTMATPRKLSDDQGKSLSAIPKSKDPDSGQKLQPGQTEQWPDRPDKPQKITSQMSQARQGADCDISDVCDIISDGLSGGTADSQDKRLSVPKSKDPDSLRGEAINAPDVPADAPTKGAPETTTGSQFQGNAPNVPTPGTPENTVPHTPKRINPGNLRVGDWVRYRGDNQMLRVQCEHSRRDGLQIIGLDGETAVIKSPKWIVSYQVSLNDLVLERRGAANL